MTFDQGLELWVGALLTFMIFSFLYKDNPFYKFAEHLFVGVSAAYWMVQGFWATLMPNLFGRLYPPMVRFALPSIADNPARPLQIIPLIFGLLLLTRLVPRISVWSRLAMGLIIGFTAGTNLTRYIQSDFVSQIGHTMVPLLDMRNGSVAIGQSFSNIVMVTGVLSGLVYFFFSKERSGLTQKVSRYGIYILMISFGASFGYTVMARISLLTGRMEFLGNWLTTGVPWLWHLF